MIDTVALIRSSRAAKPGNEKERGKKKIK